MQPLVHVGVDLAWSARNRSGLAAVDEHGALLASTTTRSDDDVAAWIAEHAPRQGVVAMDAPLIVTNPSGSRDCERRIHAAFGRFDAGAYPSNTANPHFAPPRALILARRLGLAVDPDQGERAGTVIEVYPHPAIIGLFRLGRTLKYKRKRQGFGLQLAETRRLLSLMEGIGELRLDAHAGWQRIRGIVDAASTPGALKGVEDEVDGILCAHLAWLWAQRSPMLEVYGDAATGFIVAPPEPTWAPTPRLAPTIRPAQVRGVDDGMTRARHPRREEQRMPSKRDRADIEAMWRHLEHLLSVLPAGKWTTYGDVGMALGSHARPISDHIARHRPGTYWRVIRESGTVSPEFTWADGRKDREKPVVEHLRGEGVSVRNGRADPRDRLTLDELRALLGAA